MYLHALLLLLFISWLRLAQPTLGATNVTANVAARTNSSFFLAKQGCPLYCGNIAVPYPFGIGANCSIGPLFNVTCNTSYNPPKAFIGLEVLSITETQVRMRNQVNTRCYNQLGPETPEYGYGITTESNSVYTFSHTANTFTVVGCDDLGKITGLFESKNLFGGCITTCYNSSYVAEGYCSGTGCCQTGIPMGLKSYYSYLSSFHNHSQVLSFNNCSYAFVGEQKSFQFGGTSDLSDPTFVNRILDSVPVVLDFALGANQSCDEAQNSNVLLCQQNTTCNDSKSINGYGGYLCNCMEGYEGNPYLSPGCSDIDECKDPNLNDCVGKAICTNTPGSFYCSCPRHYSGNGTTNGQGCIAPKFPAIKFSLGLSFGFLLLMIAVTWLYFSIKRWKIIKLREQFFQQNGGLLMKQKISSTDGTSSGSSKLFTVEELKKATDNYAENQILGHGGYGVVYKGILHDQRVVAIKKSKVMNGSQVEQFINELVILTQVNHRNVVKLLGCCFETEVPELVYEYVSNGTLFQHIQERLPWFTLEHRLRIASEAAGSLSYLHSAASIPIIHRDVKSTNILLDANYEAKMADFGASRLVPLDQTQVATLVQGTLGYLDPEYFHSGQLTEKSDVYSFGVVLAELLTGEKPLCFERSQEGRNLATNFIMSMKENRLFAILEPRLLREGTMEQLQAIAELVKRCLCLKSEERPTMKEVVMELEGLRKYKKHPLVRQSREEGEILLSEDATADLYPMPISPSSSISDIPRQYSFNLSMAFPHSKSFN